MAITAYSVFRKGAKPFTAHTVYRNRALPRKPVASNAPSTAPIRRAFASPISRKPLPPRASPTAPIQRAINTKGIFRR